jgi:hypothetical protein
MKIIPHPASLIALAALMSSMAGATPVANWTERTGDTPVSGLDTASPTLGDGTPDSADAMTIHATMPTVTLANVGEKVTLSGSVTLSGIVGLVSQFRWGLYDVNGSSNDTGWLGYMGNNGHGTNKAKLQERANPNTVWYMSSTGGANVDIALSASAPGTAFTADTYNFLLTLERTAGGVRIDSSIIRSSDSQQFGLISFEDDTPETYSFNRAGFLIGDGLNADQAQFSNIDVSFTEPAGPAPRITSFVGLGGGLWELTLEGAPDTEYEFRSSTTLEFAPGTLVENLTQGDPGDPGSIGGTNNSGVTTNGSGLAVVRLVLTGSPADFVRASTTP